MTRRVGNACRLSCFRCRTLTRSLAAAILVLCAGSVLAQGRTALTQGLSPQHAREMIVEVPLVIDEGASLLISNTERIRELGIARPENGLESKRYANRLKHLWAFRPATAEEIAAGKATHLGYATRYHDEDRGRTWGSVNGDGRAVALESVLIRDKKTRRFEGVYDIQIKGIKTGLIPTGATTDNTGVPEGHTTGYCSTSELGDLAYAGLFRLNGLRSADWLAYFDKGKTYSSYFTNGEGQKFVLESRAGIFVRGGSFLRLAHLNYFRDDPAAVRELLDVANRQLCAERKLKQPLKQDELLLALVRRQMQDLAAQYWLRVVDGAMTYDNNGILEKFDHGTTSTIDRTHPSFRHNTRISPGFAHEAGLVAREYMPELAGFVLRSSRHPAEQQRVRKIVGDTSASGEDFGQKVHELAEREYEQAMARGCLAHLGLDGDEVGRLMKTSREDAVALLRTVRALGETPAPKVKYSMGVTEVPDPARYDIFRALSRLISIAATRTPPERKSARLVGVMRALDPDRPRDTTAANRLLQGVQPIVEAVLARYPRGLRGEKLRVIAAQARYINRPVDLERGKIWGWSDGLKPMLERTPHKVPGAMADLQSWMRGSIRQGPRSPDGVALRLRREKMEYVDRTRVRLSRDEEDGVAIEELSDGANDAVRISLAADPLRLGDPLRYGMRYTLDGKVWLEARPQEERRGQTVFELHLESLPKKLEARFFDLEQPTREWTHHGRNFGRKRQLVLSSLLVDSELAAWAARHGRSRARSSPQRAQLGLMARAIYCAGVKTKRPALDRVPTTSNSARTRSLPVKRVQAGAERLRGADGRGPSRTP